jgi:hypothetical protein
MTKMDFLPDGVEPSGYAARKLLMKKHLREVGYEDSRWMELAQYTVQ